MVGKDITFRRLSDRKVFTLPLSQFSRKDRQFILNEKEAGRLTMSGYEGIQLKEVTPVLKAEKHINASKQIDAILAKHWQSKGVEGRPVVDDSTYLRRTYLKIIGRIPTYAEAMHFLSSEDPQKRHQLVDKLLDSQGYVSHNFNLWADILRIRTSGQQGSRYGGVYYVPWLKDQIRQNVHYDDFVRSLLTAEGYPWENPAAAYYLRDYAMPLDNMSMTTQVFLGTQLQCAQCHDHPTDVWSQKDFYELSAFTYGLKTGVRVPQDTPELQDIFQELNRRARRANDGKDPGYQKASHASAGRELLMPYRWKVTHTKRKLKLPHDYQYEDALPNDIVNPHLLFGDFDASELEDSESRVQQFASWVTAEDNARFTKVIANRMWKHAMGKGLIEPIDNLSDESVADSPELLAFLETLMKAVDYDLKQFLRVLYFTEHFEREAVIDNPDLADDFHLEGPIFQRMSSEQIWDSLATLMTPDIDLIQQESYTTYDRGVRYESGKAPGILEHMEEWSSNDLLNYVNDLTDVYKESQAARATVAEMRSDPDMRNTPALKAAQQESKAKDKVWRSMLNGSELDGNSQVPEMGMGMSMMMASVNSTSNNKANKKLEKWLSNIRRASELPSPAHRGHLLEVFGQSDRLLIENSEDGGNVLQALFLMNSPQTNFLLAHRSAPVLEARVAKTPAEKLETLYVGFLARKPTAAESEALVPIFEKNPEKARERIIWAMLNTQQFLFIQ